MNTIHARRVGTTLGLLLALFHALWTGLVYTGLAKTFLDWILKMHFLHFEYSIEPFVFLHAIILIFITGIAGYIAGFIFASLWNLLYSNTHTET